MKNLLTSRQKSYYIVRGTSIERNSIFKRLEKLEKGGGVGEKYIKMLKSM